MKFLRMILAIAGVFLAVHTAAYAQPTVTLFEGDTSADEATGDTGGFRIRRDGVDSNLPLTVAFTITGTADFNSAIDYTLSNNILWDSPNVYRWVDATRWSAPLNSSNILCETNPCI